MRDRYKAKDERSWWMRFHTNGGLLPDGPAAYNNVVRTPPSPGGCLGGPVAPYELPG